MTEPTRNSGVAWIGKLPKSWEVATLKRTTYLKGRIGWQGLTSGEYLREGEYLLVTGTDFENGRVDWSRCAHVDRERYDEDPYIQLKDNDLLVTKDGSIGKVAVVRDLPKPATLNSGVFVTRPLRGQYRPEFLYWVLISDVFPEFIAYSMVGTTINHLYQKTFERFCYPLPPLPEQARIAEYLSGSCAAIDAAVVAKRRQVEALEALRLSIITYAVTAGFNPGATRMGCDTPWFQEAPSHWRIERLKDVVSAFVDYRGKTPEKTREGIPLITARNIKNGQIDFSESQEYISEDDYDDWMVRGFPQRGDVLVTTEAPMGEVASIEDTRIALAQRIVLLKTRKTEMINEYLRYYFLSAAGAGEIRRYATGSTALGIKARWLKIISVLVPPAAEQKAVAEFLDYRCAQIEPLSRTISAQIDTLMAHKKSLVHECVTGQRRISKADLVRVQMHG